MLLRIISGKTCKSPDCTEYNHVRELDSCAVCRECAGPMIPVTQFSPVKFITLILILCGIGYLIYHFLNEQHQHDMTALLKNDRSDSSPVIEQQKKSSDTDGLPAEETAQTKLPAGTSDKPLESKPDEKDSLVDTAPLEKETQGDHRPDQTLPSRQTMEHDKELIQKNTEDETTGAITPLTVTSEKDGVFLSEKTIESNERTLPPEAIKTDEAKANLESRETVEMKEIDLETDTLSTPVDTASVHVDTPDDSEIETRHSPDNKTIPEPEENLSSEPEKNLPAMFPVEAGTYEITPYFRRFVRFFDTDTIEIQKTFFIQAGEVTIEDFRTFYKELDASEQERIGTLWEKGNDGTKYPGNQPVEYVSHDHAIEYVRWLNRKTGSNLSLPTLNQWIAAALTYGEDQPVLYSNYGRIHRELRSEIDHLIGNLREWSSDICGDEKYRILGENYMTDTTDPEAVGNAYCALSSKWIGVGFRFVKIEE